MFNGLDGRTARRVKRLHYPAGLISAVGRNVPKYFVDPSASTGGQSGQSCAGCPPDFRAERIGPSPRREAAGEHHTICTLNENRDKAAPGGFSSLQMCPMAIPGDVLWVLSHQTGVALVAIDGAA